MSEATYLEKTQLVPQLMWWAVATDPPPLRCSTPSTSPADELWLWFRDGCLVDALTAGAPSLLESAVQATEKLTEKERKRFEKQAKQEGCDWGALALEQGLIKAEELAPAVLAVIDRRLGAFLAAPDAELFPADGERAPPHSRGVAEWFQLAIPFESLLREGARIAGRWDRIRDQMPTLHEVYYATPGAMSYVNAAEDYPFHAALLNELDGQRDLADAIDAAAVDPFACWQALDELVQAGAVQAINPVQLFQLGNDCEHRGEYSKALRLFERAEQRGLDDFDLGFRLAELYERSGQRELAVDRFLRVAEKCFSQFRIEDTIRCCRRILALDAENDAVQDRYVSLLARYGKGEEAIAAGLAMARRLQAAGDVRRAQTTMEKIVDLAEANEEVLRCYLELCQTNGHETGAAKARRTLAQLFHQREETGKALELYQGLFVAGEDTPEIRQKLAELHLRAGNTSQAVAHLQALERCEGWSPRQPLPEAVAFFRGLLASGVRTPEVTAWLTDEARMRGSRAEMLVLLDQHRQALEATGSLEEAMRCAEQLVRQAPRNVEYARAYSSLQKRCGDIGGAAMVLEQLAERLAGDANCARDLDAVLTELIALNPLSLRGRRLLLTHCAKGRDQAAQQRLQIETALLSLVAGEAARAHSHLEGLASALVLAPAIDWIAGLLAAASNEREKAAQHFLKSARGAAALGDRGTLGAVLEQIRAMDPHQPELERLERVYLNLPDPATASQVRAPEVLQSRVSGITARLKDFKKGGADGDGPRIPAGAIPPAMSLKGLDRLQALRGAGAAAPPSGDSAETTGAGAKATPVDGDVASRIAQAGQPLKKGKDPCALDALKRLRGSNPNGGETTGATSAAGTGTGEADAGAELAVAQMPGNSTTKAASTAKRKKGSDLDPVAKLKKVAAGTLGTKKPESLEASAPSSHGDAEVAARLAKSGEATPLSTPQKLNNSASRLSALRKPAGS